MTLIMQETATFSSEIEPLTACKIFVEKAVSDDTAFEVKLLVSADIALCAEKLCKEHCAAGSAAQGVVAEADELVIVLCVRAETSD